MNNVVLFRKQETSENKVWQVVEKVLAAKPKDREKVFLQECFAEGLTPDNGVLTLLKSQFEKHSRGGRKGGEASGKKRKAKAAPKNGYKIPFYTQSYTGNGICCECHHSILAGVPAFIWAKENNRLCYHEHCVPQGQEEAFEAGRQKAIDIAVMKGKKQ